MAFKCKVHISYRFNATGHSFRREENKAVKNKGYINLTMGTNRYNNFMTWWFLFAVLTAENGYLLLTLTPRRISSFDLRLVTFRFLFACKIKRLYLSHDWLSSAINCPTARLDRQLQGTGDVTVFQALQFPPDILGSITLTALSVISLHGLDRLRDYVGQQDIQFSWRRKEAVISPSRTYWCKGQELIATRTTYVIIWIFWKALSGRKTIATRKFARLSILRGLLHPTPSRTQSISCLMSYLSSAALTEYSPGRIIGLPLSEENLWPSSAGKGWLETEDTLPRQVIRSAPGCSTVGISG